MQRLAALLLTVVLVGAASAAPTASGSQTIQTFQARSADSFVESVGVNVHLTYSNGVYDRFERVRAALRKLGVRHIRDGVSRGRPDVSARLRALAADGIKLDAIAGDPLRRWGTGSLRQQLKLLESLGPRVIASIEGPNEFDNEGIGGWAPILRSYQRRLWRGVNARPRLAQIPVLGPSLVHPESRGRLGTISAWTDEGNMHPYPGGEPPDTDSHMLSELALAARNTPGERVQATETGYTNAVRTPGGHLPASEWAAGIYMPRLFLDSFRRGITRSYVYELIDLARDPSRREEANGFGLLRNDFSPKPAYRATRNLIALLSDHGPSFEPGSLSYAVVGAPADLRQVLLQKRDGRFYLALWRPQSVWDQDRRRTERPRPSAVQIEFGQEVAGGSVYVPNRSSLQVAGFEATRSLPVSVGPAVTVVEIR